MRKPNNAVGPQVRNKKKAAKGKLIPAMAITSLAAGIQAATQYFAYSFNYQELLGPNFNHIYAPWSYFNGIQHGMSAYLMRFCCWQCGGGGCCRWPSSDRADKYDESKFIQG